MNLIDPHLFKLRPIEQVALVTGHKDWKMLRRYTHLKPESLHELHTRRAA
jgi:hypothetical protein